MKRKPEPWWPVHLEFGAILAVSLVAVVMTRSPLVLAAVVTAYTALLRRR